MEGEPKILFIDIETAPNTGYSWGKWEQNIIEFIESWYILCFAYKWQGDKTKVVALPDFPNYRPRSKDKRLVKFLWQLLDRADIVVGQNSDNFDLKKINTRFLQYKMPPPSPYRTVDTLKVARKFAFNSNKLDDLGKDLGEGRKVKHTGFDLWLGCMNGNKKSWTEMRTYNKQDVDLLERVYKRLLPWITNHPSVAMFSRNQVCPRCGSDKGFNRSGMYRNKTTQYVVWRCKKCRGQARTPINSRDSKPLISV